MKIDGKNVDMLQWLKDTGGNNAIKRFSAQQTAAQASQQNTTAPKKLTNEAAAALKTQMQFSKAGIVSGMTTDNTLASYLGQLKALQTATAPTAGVTAAATQAANANGNATTVTGANNTVNLNEGAGLVKNYTVTVNGAGNSITGYNGGQQNNAVTVSGNANRMLAGENVRNSTVTVKGGENTVNLASNASNNTVAITGENVKVSIGTEGLSSGSNQNWNISVAASNVEVSVFNGKATVTMADELKDKYKVVVDNTAKSVTITAI
jgi:hypothetical protein